MTAIFISHSSADNASAARMKAWLEAQGHTSLFLDFDPGAGILAGTNWEQTLYRKLRQCQTVIALLSPDWLASRWCFAELVQARERGKPVFFVKVEPVDSSGLFSDVQHIDLTQRADEGFERLRLGLLARGLDPLDAFDWDPHRPPYPGLLAFDEADAAIFFGRGEALAKTLEALDALRRESGEAPRFVLLLGASGSGKSSLARAGVIPRLKKQPGEWLPVPPLRPQLEPLDELALALAAAFDAQGRPRDWRSLRDILVQAADATPTDGAALLGLARDLALGSRQTETTVLLTLDQAEELFGYTPKPAAERFIRLLRAALESGDRRLMVMATLRSEFLAEFQSHPALQDQPYGHHLRYRALTVDPMPQASVAEIIRGPAQLAGLQLDPRLIDAMVGDMGTPDALPLLAFTLRRIYDRTGADGSMTLAAYEAVGRLDGAVRQEAERIVGEAQPGAEDLEALHAAFVPTLVRITAEGGYVRRRALVEQMPQRVLALLRRFIDARLLVSDRDAQGRETHEVAHEALLRTWPQLSDWLSQDKDSLRLLEGLHSAALEWQQAERRDDLLVHRDGRLRDLDALLASPRFKLPEASVEQRYIDACRAAQQAREAAELAERERRLRDAERIAEEQTRAADAERRRATTLRRFGVLATLLFVLALAGALVATQQYREASAANERVGEVQQLTRYTGDTDSRPQRSLLLAVRAAALGKDDAVGTLTAIDGLRQQLLTTGGQPLRQHAAIVAAAAFSPDRRWLATGDESGAIWLWDLSAADPTARAQRLDGHTARVSGMAFSRDGRWLVSGGNDGSVRVWRVDGTEAKASNVFALGALGAVQALAISRDGRWLAFGTQAGSTCLWRMTDEGPAQAPCERGKSEDPVMQVLFSPGGRWLATTCTGGCKGFGAPVRLWDLSAATAALQAEAEPRELVHQKPLVEDSLLAVAFNGDDTRLAVAYGYFVELWDLTLPAPPEKPVGSFASGGGWVSGVALSADQRWLAIAGGSAADVQLWDLRGGVSAAPLLLKGHGAPVGSLRFSDEGRWLASGAVDASARLWDLSTPTAPSKLLRGHDQGVVRTAFVPGTQPGHLVSWSGDANARLWSIPDGLADPIVRRSPGALGITGMALGAAGNEAATSAEGENVLRLWSVADANKPARELPLPSSSHAVAFSPDGRWLAAKSHNKGVISLWDLKSASSEPVSLVEHAYGEIGTLRFSPDGRWLASGTWADPSPSSLNLWDVSGPSPSLEPRHRCAVSEPLRELTFTADGRGLAAGVHGRTVRIWNMASPTPCADPRVLPHDNVVYQVAFSPDGRWAATASFDQKGRLWDLQGAAAPKLVREVVFKDRVLQTAFSPDGRSVAFGSWDNTAALLSLQDVAAATPVVLSGHVGRLGAIAFSPDSQWLATASEDRSIRLWSQAAPTAAPLVLRGHEASVQHLGFTPDGGWLLSGAYDGTVRKWRLRRDDLIEVACRTAGRELTAEEAAKFLPANVTKGPCGGR